MKQWFLYIIECRDGTLYTGITTDVEHRLQRHNQGRAAKYTRGRGPVKLRYNKAFDNESLARKWEIEVKKMSRYNKLRMISNSKSLQ